MGAEGAIQGRSHGEGGPGRMPGPVPPEARHGRREGGAFQEEALGQEVHDAGVGLVPQVSDEDSVPPEGGG